MNFQYASYFVLLIPAVLYILVMCVKRYLDKPTDYVDLSFIGLNGKKVKLIVNLSDSKQVERGVKG